MDSEGTARRVENLSRRVWAAVLALPASPHRRAMIDPAIWLSADFARVVGPAFADDTLPVEGLRLQNGLCGNYFGALPLKSVSLQKPHISFPKPRP
jgi:hypothetical protein